MQGKRLPDNVVREFAQPGDFWRKSQFSGGWEWEVVAPDGSAGTLAGYDVYLHDDHMISVKGEIVNCCTFDRWKLEHGFWTRVNDD